jgi:hypothetical protein
MRSVRGHTVLELLVVVAVMMILAAIALPAMSPGTDRRLDTVQLAMQDALDHAQTLATNKAAPFGVRFDATNEWFAVVDELGEPVEDPLVKAPYIVRLMQPGEPPDVVIDSADFGGYPLAVFNDKGVLESSGEVRLRAGSTQRWLAVNTATAALTEVPLDD